MTTLDDFTPESPFGVPLSSFPPGAKWASTREMLVDALDLLRVPWVRRYLLDCDPLQDAEVLHDRKRLSMAMPLVFRATALSDLSGGFEAEMLHVRYNVPAFNVGDIGVGVGVEWTGGVGASDLVFTLPKVFVHFAINQRTGEQVIVSEREKLGTIDFTYMVHRPNGLWSYAMVVFNRMMFRSAFLRVGMDLDLVERALVRTIVGGVFHHSRPSLTHSSYPYRLADNHGEHCMKSVFCSYLDANPVMAFPVFAEASWSFEFENKVLRTMQAWGMKERLGRWRIPPPNNAPIVRYESPFVHDTDTNDTVGVNEIPETNVLDPAIKQFPVFAEENDFPTPPTASVAQPSNSMALPTKPIRKSGAVTGVVEFTKIAPAPAPQPETRRVVTEEEHVERERMEKLERRKLQKREAAARSNAKKSAERRRLRLEREKAQSKNQKMTENQTT